MVTTMMTVVKIAEEIADGGPDTHAVTVIDYQKNLMIRS
jgi:hypothetical protein